MSNWEAALRLLSLLLVIPLFLFGLLVVAAQVTRVLNVF